MFEIRNDIKDVVKRLGHNLSDLSRALNMNYDSLGAYLNGRRKMPVILFDKIKEKICEWENGVQS